MDVKEVKDYVKSQGECLQAYLFPFLRELLQF